MRYIGTCRRLERQTGQRQKGVALIIVLWILLLVTISTGAYTLMARMDQLEAHTVLAGTQARLAAEAGMNMAILSLRDPDALARLTPDGRPFTVNYRGAIVEVEIIDERGKLNINAADEPTLIKLFTSNEVEEGVAIELAAAIRDWTDPDEIERAHGAELETYEANELAVGPGNRQFVMNEELLQVIGMPWELYKRIEPGLTVHTDSSEIVAAFAPVESLLALPEMTEDDALNFVAERQSQDATNTTGLTLPSGEVAMAPGRGLTYSIFAKATLPNGVWDQIEATIRLGGNGDGRPYSILRWREGFHH